MYVALPNRTKMAETKSPDTCWTRIDWFKVTGDLHVGKHYVIANYIRLHPMMEMNNLHIYYMHTPPWGGMNQLNN